MKYKILICLLTLINVLTFGQERNDVEIKHMLNVNTYVKSSIIDSIAPGGFGGSNNFAKKLNIDFREKGLFLKIDTTKVIPFKEKYNGYELYLVNKNDSIISLNASDSRIDVIAEVFYKKEWSSIEYLTNSWCGNSYHTVYLKPDEYWTFNIPKFTGKIETKLRYKLIIDENNNIYSNEIKTKINKGQIYKKKKYRSRGIMDPYQ